LRGAAEKRVGFGGRKRENSGVVGVWFRPGNANGAEKALLTGLADCLPPECYDAKYLD